MIRPMGARVLVLEDAVTLEIEERAKRAGLALVVDEAKRPKPTRGRVVAVGDDPLLQEQVHVGDFITFAPHAGFYNFVDGEKLRVIEHIEIVTVESVTDASDLPSAG